MKKEIKRATQSFWRLLLLMVAFNSSLSLFAQTQTVSGIVLDEFGDPMIGVSVLVKGTTTGIITDVEGNFTVPAKTGDVLLVKYLGYKDQEIKVTSDARLKITLYEDTQNLDEVVVVGYGSMKQKNITGFCCDGRRNCQTSGSQYINHVAGPDAGFAYHFRQRPAG